MTFLTDVMKKGYTEEEILAVLVESKKDRKRKLMLAMVTATNKVLHKKRADYHLQA